ncbi:hypothetical protein ACFWAD_11845 [Rhodococcus sp. NPDC059969]
MTDSEVSRSSQVSAAESLVTVGEGKKFTTPDLNRAVSVRAQRSSDA